MAIDLENKENVNPADSDFPFGDVRDKTPTLGGTKYNRNTMSDYIQFFHKMMAEAGIAYNNQLDNEYSGWQFFEAFRKLTKPYKIYMVNLTQTGTNAPVATELINELGVTPVWSYEGVGEYACSSTGAFAGNRVVMMSQPSSFNYEFRTTSTDDVIGVLTNQYQSLNTPPTEPANELLINTTLLVWVMD